MAIRRLRLPGHALNRVVAAVRVYSPDHAETAGRLDHVSVGVSDLARSREFYRHALTPLRFSELGPWRDGAEEVTFGLEEADDFAISTAYATGAPVHVAFAADRREQVDAFYSAALEAGGRDNGTPRLRPEYSDGYYSAFVLDPDGQNIEAVHHGQ